MYKTFEARLLENAKGAILLENFRRCVNSGVVQPAAIQSFKSAFETEALHLQSVNVAIPNPADLCDIAIKLLEAIPAPVDENMLRNSFGASQWKKGFDACRVITNQTLRDRYLAEEEETDSYGSRTSFDPTVDPITDAEFDQCSPASIPTKMRLHPQIRLCKPNGTAFITDASGWDSSSANGGELADRAAEYLGLPYDQGEALAMLRIRSDAICNWTVVRRPTIFDALDHGWWICWDDDPADCGHTLDLVGLADGTPALRKGGFEWMIDDQFVIASDDKVQVIELGATRNNTHAGQHSALWKTFHAKLNPRGLE